MFRLACDPEGASLGFMLTRANVSDSDKAQLLIHLHLQPGTMRVWTHDTPMMPSRLCEPIGGITIIPPRANRASTPNLGLSLSRVAAQSSLYFSERPRAFSTGYFAALRAIFARIADARSMFVWLANSRQ